MEGKGGMRHFSSSPKRTTQRDTMCQTGMLQSVLATRWPMLGTGGDGSCSSGS